MQPSALAPSQPPSVKPFQKVPEKAALLGNIIDIVEKEYRRGNSSITQEKYAALLKLQELQKARPIEPKLVPVNPYPSLYYKFNLPSKKQAPVKVASSRKIKRPWTFKRVEAQFISVLETIANILDNLYLLSRMPVFPKFLSRLLKNTNQIWVLILLFLIRKTISQLLNVRRKEAKVQAELSILRSSANYKLLEDDKVPGNENIFRKYEKIIKDLSFDKMMLKIELVGNLLDLSFNAIELKNWPVPDWFMSSLNMASMAMTIYRMNKDDEYVDDDITEDLI